jgi:hypothetical protein
MTVDTLCISCTPIEKLEAVADKIGSEAYQEAIGLCDTCQARAAEVERQPYAIMCVDGATGVIHCLPCAMFDADNLIGAPIHDETAFFVETVVELRAGDLNGKPLCPVCCPGGHVTLTWWSDEGGEG